MGIFLSWSGPRSHQLALNLREWLPLVVQYADPWMSSADIQAGDRWSPEIAKRLESSAFGILCVTRENLTNPWLLFEAGALAKAVDDGRVVPLLLDVDVQSISGPLAQFQAKKCDPKGIRDTILSVNKSAATPLDDARCAKIADAMIPNFLEKVDEIPASENPKTALRTTEEILEEVVTQSRSLDQKIDDLSRLIRMSTHSTNVFARSYSNRRHALASKYFLAEDFGQLITTINKISPELREFVLWSLSNDLRNTSDNRSKAGPLRKTANFRQRLSVWAQNKSITLTPEQKDQIEFQYLNSILKMLRDSDSNPPSTDYEQLPIFDVEEEQESANDEIQEPD